MWDATGHRLLDGLSGLFTVQVGHGRRDLAEAARDAGRDARVLPDLDVRAPARDRARGPPRRPRARRPQPRVLHHRRVRSGRVGVEARPPVLPGHRPGAAPQGDRARAPRTTAPRWARSRSPACPRCARRSSRSRPARQHVPNTNRYRHPLGDDEKAFMLARHRRDRGARSCSKGPRPSPRCSSSRCRTRAGASCRPRATSSACARSATGYGVLLVSDEVICAFGRLGTMFGCERYDYLPDIITCAKGLTSGYSPLGAVICRDFLAEPFLEDKASFAARPHLRRSPGELRGRRSPTSTCSSEEQVLDNVLAHEAGFRERLERLRDLPIVGDVRGAGYFRALELVPDPASDASRSPPSSARSCCAASSLPRFYEAGLIAPHRRPRRPRGPARAAARRGRRRARRAHRRAARGPHRGVGALLRLSQAVAPAFSLSVARRTMMRVQAPT